MARVGRRAAIVEPSPPADPLGKRIAALYARAKRESGQFEGYQPIDYWRRLLAAVKADVWQNLFTFTRVPPREAVSETFSLIANAMAIEGMPRSTSRSCASWLPGATPNCCALANRPGRDRCGPAAAAGQRQRIPPERRPRPGARGRGAAPGERRRGTTAARRATAGPNERLRLRTRPARGPGGVLGCPAATCSRTTASTGCG